MGRSSLLGSRSGNIRPDNAGQNVLTMIGNVCFSILVVGVVIFTIISATYEVDDPSNRIATFLTSMSDATFNHDNTFMVGNESGFESVINLDDLDVTPAVEIGEQSGESDCKGKTGEPVDCRGDGEIYHLLMKVALEKFPDTHFFRFGKPVQGDGDLSCHMAYRFRPKGAETAPLSKDYRNFELKRGEDCSLSVVKIGDYHSGGNARKVKKPSEKTQQTEGQDGEKLPVIGEDVDDSLPEVESEESFIRGKYLIYSGGGDRCKSMNHYLWSFMCALGEAQYLNRTLIMDMSICLSSIYTSSGQNEEGKDFRYYFDFEHLKDSASVLDQKQFWVNWSKWHKKDRLKLHLVEDFKVAPMKLAKLSDTLIMRKFGLVEPDNYSYRVCEGKTRSVVKRPWHLIWKSRRLMSIVAAISSRLNSDYDSVHIVRGEKARNKELWPNLDADTSPKALTSTLADRIDSGRNLYIVTDEPDTSFFDPLKDKYSTHFLDEYKDLWDRDTEWYRDTSKHSNGAQVEFDGYMRVSVDTEIFLRGKKQIDTFNDLTKDCKDGVNTCTASS